MKKEVKVWKVLRKELRTSVSNLDSLSLYYPVNEFIKPKVGKIFCFKDEKDAKNFQNYDRKYWSVHESLAINPKPTDKMASLWTPSWWENKLAARNNDRTVKIFWNKHLKYSDITPKGSYICDELKCLE